MSRKQYGRSQLRVPGKLSIQRTVRENSIRKAGRTDSELSCVAGRPRLRICFKAKQDLILRLRESVR